MKKAAFVVMVAAVFGGCAEMPTGPTVAVMPAPGKPFDQFMADQAVCKNYAQGELGNAPASAQNRAVAGAATGALLGAAAGALLGGSHRGTGAGAGIGLLAGSAIGSDNAQASGFSLQRRYNIAYEQCMYAKGNQIPGYSYAPSRYVPPPPPSR